MHRYVETTIRRELKDNLVAPNFVLNKKYKLPASVIAVARKFLGMSLNTDDNTFIVTEVNEQGDFVWSHNIKWGVVAGHSSPPPPHPEWGSPLYPDLQKFCTLVDE